jgi:hypothetical protein
VQSVPASRRLPLTHYVGVAVEIAAVIGIGVLITIAVLVLNA